MTDGAVGALLAATNYSAIIRPLQWLVVALIFLFFLRVVRAVFVEIRPAGARQTRARPRRPPAGGAGRAGVAPRRRALLLEVVEPADQAGPHFDLDDELTVGRAPGCGIPTTYDTYSSTLHARFFRRGDQLWVEDLGSTNGTYVNAERISKPMRWAGATCSRSGRPCSRSPGDRPAFRVGQRRRPRPVHQPGPGARVPNLFAVADGMGGHAGGEVAARWPSTPCRPPSPATRRSTASARP